MARDGKAEEEIWSSIAERFKSTMAVVEKQVTLYTFCDSQTCELHSVSLDVYRKSFEKYSSEASIRFKNACYPCRFLLSRIENTELEKPEIPESLTVNRVLILNQAIIELSCRCMDRIKALLCGEMNVDEETLKKNVSESESLKEQVFDLVVDAEKGSKKKILEDEGVEESDMIICGLLYKDDEVYEAKMQELSDIRIAKLAELGLSSQFLLLFVEEKGGILFLRFCEPYTILLFYFFNEF